MTERKQEFECEAVEVDGSAAACAAATAVGDAFAAAAAAVVSVVAAACIGTVAADVAAEAAVGNVVAVVAAAEAVEFVGDAAVDDDGDDLTVVAVKNVEREEVPQVGDQFPVLQRLPAQDWSTYWELHTGLSGWYPDFGLTRQQKLLQSLPLDLLEHPAEHSDWLEVTGLDQCFGQGTLLGQDYEWGL